MDLKYSLLLFLLLNDILAFAQYNNNWCLGDSIRLNFSTSPPTVYHDAKLTFGEPVVSVSNASGQLLFYGNQDVIYNQNRELMANGEGPFANSKSTTQGMLVLPIDTLGKYQLFSLSNDCPTIGICLKYSTINLNENTGLGKVSEPKNILLYDPGSQRLSEKLYAIKHANGEDWWVIISNYRPNNFVIFQVNDQKISNPIILETNNIHERWYGQMISSSNGEKIVAVTRSVIDLFDFDRCTGQLSNPVFLEESDVQYYGCSFSPNSRFLYISTWGNPINEFFQYDLQASDIAASKIKLWETIEGDEDEIGQHLLGLDGKIYISHNLSLSFNPPGYTYVNQNLSVIHNPNQAGQACDFQPHSLYVGSKRTSFGLPNLPNFNLEAIPLPPVDAGLDPTICQNESIRLGTPPQAGLEYSWSPTFGLSDPLDAQPTASPSQTTTYILTLIDPSRACRNVAFDTVTVTVSNCSSLHIPNVFSPNGDGIGDVFEPYNDFGIEVLEMQIYNRWGRKLYVGVGSAIGWNGSRPSGENAPIGSYYYWIRYRTDGQEVKEVKGQLMLLR